MQRRSRARLGTVLALVVSLVALLPTGASASTQYVYMPGYSFSPTPRTISRGDKVRWYNDSFINHDVKSNLKGYFVSPGGAAGLGRKDYYDKTFKQAGTFGYICRIHEGDNMKGKIVVPIAVSRNGNTFTITAASSSVSGTKWRNRIQVKKPGSSSWISVSTTSAKSATFSSTKHGTFQFRSATKNSETGALSGYSPTVTKTK